MTTSTSACEKKRSPAVQKQLEANKMKNPVAKYARRVNRAVVMPDKKKALKRGENQKHKTKGRAKYEQEI